MKEEKVGIFETIKRRRSTRKYTKEPVSENLILKILEAGRWAPSAGNSQPWSFIVLRDGEVRRKIADATTTGKFLANAPIGIAVVIDPRASKHPVEDGSIATENMLLAAQALGLGACWIGSYNSVYENRVKKILCPKGQAVAVYNLDRLSRRIPHEDQKRVRRNRVYR